MATASQTLEVIRAGLETTEGTSVTPTRFLYVPEDSLKLLYKKEGIIVGLAWNKQDNINDVLSGIETVGIQVTGVPISFQDFGYWLAPFDATGFSGAPTTVDTTAYKRTGPPSQTDNTMSATGVRSMTIQWGASDFISTWGVQIPGLIGEELTIHFNKTASGADTGLTFDAKYMTASPVTPITAFTGAPSDRTQTWAVGNLLKAYSDTSTIGTTADPNIVSASITWSKHNVYHDGMDNTGNHTTMHRPQGWDTSMQFLRKFSDLTELNAYLGAATVKTLRKVRIIAEGAQIGAVSAKNTIQADFYGKHSDLGDIPNRQGPAAGVHYQDFTLTGMYDGTALASLVLMTQNTVSASYLSA